MTPRYWLEITKRPDLGADLWAPQTNEGGKRSYWGYSLIHDVQPGDIVLHYHKRKRAIVAYSRADGTAGAEEIEWAAQGTAARSAGIKPHRRPGWSLPLTRTLLLRSPLTLATIRKHHRQVMTRQGTWGRLSGDARYMPFVTRRDGMRPQQAYLTRFPPSLVRLFPALHEIVRPNTAGVIASRPTVAPSRVRSSVFGKPYKKAVTQKSVAKRTPAEVDPEKVDRGVHGHQLTQDLLAEYVENIMRCRPRSPRRAAEPPFDLGWKQGGVRYVVEVKSLTKENEDRHLRLGLGQVLDYWRKLAQAGQKARAVFAVECEPSDRAFVAFCRDIGVVVVWPGHFDVLLETPWPARDLVLSESWRNEWAGTHAPPRRPPARARGIKTPRRQTRSPSVAV